jgi:hypothetical protein
MKRNLKIVQRLKWFTFAMWLSANALLLWLGKAAADGWFADKIALGVIYTIVLVLGWGFWFEWLMACFDVEQEIEDKMKERAKK